MDGREAAKQLGPVGVWTNLLERLPIARATDVAKRIEAAGYGALWFPEALGSKEMFVQASLYLSATTRVRIAPGIANIHARDAVAMANGARALEEAFPGRFVLGMGVSHAPSVANRGGTYRQPVATMAGYLDRMEAAPITLKPAPMPARLLAALGPRMLELARDRTDGAHPFFVPLEHTAFARNVLGPRPCLAVEVACVVTTDPVVARKVGRTYTQRYLGLDNYTNNLRRLGWGDADLAGDGSDRLVDAVVAWGPVEKIAEHVAQHRAAGADHVCLQVLRQEWMEPPLDEWAALAKAAGI
ncbi:MAG: TIGR03620 family F420-dependent LLM class oxidoreductase [Chloroflexi bacterium]|nr:TIGR03620 family F420-dependent LLM class oxidoreductase [Chloroflexota bacterium]